MKVQTLSRTVNVEIADTEIELEVEFEYTPEDPGKLTGLPEDCYPPEPSELELQQIEYSAEDGRIMDFSYLLEITAFCEWLENEINDILESEDNS